MNRKNNKVFILCASLVAVSTMSAALITASAEQSNVSDWIDIVWAESEYEQTELSDGLKGYSYPVPSCKAVDNHNNEVKGLSVLVYAPDETLVSVVDERFATPVAGEYKIVYTVQHNELYREKVISVNVLETCEALSYEISSLTESEVYTGERVLLYEGEIKGGLGEKEVRISCKRGDVEVTTFNNGGVSYFTPTISGEYTLTYEVTDFVSCTYQQTHKVVVTDSLKPILSTPAIPQKVLAGKMIKLPLVEAMYYAGEDSWFVPVKVVVDGVDVSDTMSFTTMDTDGEHTIVYSAGTGDNVATYEQTITVVNHQDWDRYDGNYAYIDNYITLNDCTRWFENGNFIFGANERDYSLDFSNKINAHLLKFDFAALQGKTEFSAIRLHLRDSVNASDYIEIDFKQNVKNDNTEVYVNGIYGGTVDYKFGNEASLSVSVDTKMNALMDSAGNVLAKIPAYFNGKKFDGFTSGDAYLSIGAVGVNGESAVKILSVCGDIINNMSVDVAQPHNIPNENYKALSAVAYGNVIVVPYIEFFDFYEYDCKVMLNIVNSKGTIIFEGEIKEDYSFTADEYGKYTVEYSAYDSADNLARMFCSFEVADFMAPTLSVTGSVPTTAIVGEEIIFPEATYSDNMEKTSFYMYVMGGEHKQRYVYDYKYTFNEVGEYVVRYVVHDTEMNTVVLEYKITVKAGE